MPHRFAKTHQQTVMRDVLEVQGATRSHLLTAALIAALAAPPALWAQTVVYVDRNADQIPHDGSDWCHAYLEVYEALAAAEPDTVIRVADGYDARCHRPGAHMPQKWLQGGHCHQPDVSANGR